jgi:alkanesulfonate monooxygenase SsuD/methylene tetrahydromethanopterin reductase-like flavin-dependent oxidoreductase (luciferase family)
MQVCVSTLMPYLEPVPDGHLPADPRGPWPSPPRDFDPEVGMRSLRLELDFLELADDLGFDWVAVTEHHYLPRISPAPLVLAGALSQRIRKARVAVLGATLPILNPVRVAEEMALVDNLLQGRLVACLLRGTAPELVAYHVDAAESRGMYDEGIDLILKAWTEPEPFSWDSPHYHFPVVSIWPTPVQRPRPPVFISGKSRESGSLAARKRLSIGLSFESVAEARDAVQHYRSAAEQEGWQPTADDVLYRGYCYVAETDEQAREMARRSIFGRRESLGPGRLERGSLAGADTSEGWEAGFFSGSPDTVYRQIQRVAEATGGLGLGTVDLLFNDNRGWGAELTHDEAERSVRLFAREVLPRLHAL